MIGFEALAFSRLEHWSYFTGICTYLAVKDELQSSRLTQQTSRS